VIESRDNKLTDLVASLMTAMHRFWIWWISELRGMLPVTWRSALDAGNNRLVVVLEDEQLILGVLDRDQLTDIVRVGEDDDSLPALIRDYCLRNQLNAGAAVLGLGRKQAMIKNLSLPRAVEENLEGMLKLEMDRHTPFTAEDVFFTQRVVSRDRSSEKITVELVVVPKRTAAEFMDRLATIGIMVSSMVVRLQDGAPEAGDFVAFTELLKVNEKVRSQSAIRQNRRRLALAVLVLAISALLIPAIHDGLVGRSLQQEVDTARLSAEKAQDARKQLLALEQPGEEFLLLRSSTPLAIAVLNEVTRIVPDHTWLDRVEVDQGMIRLHGESEQAAVLLALFENSTLFSDARFSSTITRNARSERDRFAIEATINEQVAL
jgi:general secretion pathway protein L